VRVQPERQPCGPEPGHVAQLPDRDVIASVPEVSRAGGPELQDQRYSSSYLICFNGIATVLTDAGGGSALRFGQNGASVAPLEVVLLTHLHVDHTADLPALVKSSFFENRTRPLPPYRSAGNDSFPPTTQLVQTLFGTPSGAYRYLANYVSGTTYEEYHPEAHDLSLAAGRSAISTMLIAPSSS
jgi:ribonuclease BN (tRNA processing enzyme)